MQETPTAREGTRHAWVDILRGLAILLVVLFHVDGRFLEVYGGYSWGLSTAVRAYMPMQMPALMFLAGVLLAPSLRKGAARFLDAKSRNILYPYLLWAVLTIVVLVLVQPFTGTAHSFAAILRIPYEAPGGLWFLQYLVAFYVMVVLLQRVPRLAQILTSVVLAVAAQLMGSDAAGFFLLYAVFLSGDIAGRDLPRWLELARDRRIWALSWGVLAGFVLLAVADRGVPSVALSFLLLLVGMLAYTQLAWALVGTRIGRVLAYTGRNSLVIYVVHMLTIPIALAALQVVLPQSNLTLLALSTMVLTTFLSFLPVWLEKPIPQVRWLFSFPRPVFPAAAVRGPETPSEQIEAPGDASGAAPSLS
jgi:fucose 4-O-acetylase-like acetyltransferase